MKRQFGITLAAVVLFGSIVRAGAVAPTGDEMAAAQRWAVARFAGLKIEDKVKASGPVASSEPPFSFVYGGRPSAEFLATWKLETSTKALDGDRSERTLVWTDPRTGLVVRCAAVVYSDFPTVEWTVYVKNAGSKDSPIIEDLQALDADFVNRSGREFLLHHGVGSPCQPNDFQPLETPLGPGAEKRISAKGGRPTNSDMSYFNLEWKGGGTILAVGWPAQWSATFRRDKSDGLRVRAGQELTHFTLHPGEEIRTPLIVLQFWAGEWIRSQNIWRRWMIAHNMPHPNGRPLPTHFDSCWGNMKPTAEEEVAMVEGFARERIHLDYWILDAGWFPNGEWWDTIGTWTPDPARFPKGLRPIADAAHATGVKFVVWYEPERVTPNSWLAANHRDWVLPRPGAPAGVPPLTEKDHGILNLGNPEARKWLVDYLDAMFKAEGIDVLRTDFNIDPLARWRENDSPDRQGITENHYVTGLLSYWDELLSRNPSRWIDTCASGGRRNDLETLRRAAPLLRSDYTEKPVAHQCHTYGLSLWLPWYGSGTGNTDPYLIRSSICPAWRIGLDMRKKDNDYDGLRKHVADFRTIAPNLMGDYFPLTPYSQEDDVWMAFQFDKPEAGTGTIMAFRRAKCEAGTSRFKLSALDRKAEYEVRDLDSIKPVRLMGAELMDRGIPVTVKAKPGAALLVYKKV
jgi:alpha-galactosidase